MTLPQFSLFFAAILIAFVLVHYRLIRFERYLKEIVGLKQLNERLKGVSDSVERVRLDRVEEQLSLLHDDLGRIEEAQQGVARALGRATSQKPVTIAGPAESHTPSPSDLIRGAVETRLLSLGYGNLRILSDLSEAELDDAYEVRVECEKQRMQHKGVVVTRNGSVVDVQLRSVQQVFP